MFRNTTPADDLENLPLRCAGFNTHPSAVLECVFTQTFQQFVGVFPSILIHDCVIFTLQPAAAQREVQFVKDVLHKIGSSRGRGLRGEGKDISSRCTATVKRQDQHVTLPLI